MGGNVDIGVRCIECTSPVLRDMERILSRPESSAQITYVLNGLFKSIIDKAEEAYLYDYIALLLKDAPKYCASSPEYEPGFEGTNFPRLYQTEYDVEYPGFSKILISSAMVVVIFIALKVVVWCRMRIGRNGFLLTL